MVTPSPVNGKSRRVNGESVAARPSVAEYFGRSNRAALSIDSARSGTDLDGHWAFADSLSADAAYSQAVRHTLVKRSRYEALSNAFYAGICTTHVNMLVGTGPTLRMLTGSRDFNQLVEREFFRWTQAIQLRRKLWAMAHAVTADGEAFGILQTNPGLRGGAQLDVMPIEAEQCQSAHMGYERGRVDGIIYDDFNNIVAYEILPEHPGGLRTFLNVEPVEVPARNVIHWFKLRRPGAHRGIPAMTAGMNTGAYHRRFREATVAAAETAADIGAVLTSNMSPSGDSEPDPVAPFTSIEFVKRMLMVAPMGWDAKQMKGEHPNAQYAEFHRTLLSELARPMSMPYNAAACDSSTYSFASGKLDTLCYRAALDVERADCNDLVLDPLFAEWFREWTILDGRRDIPPTHQWDWPTHPVIDAVAEAQATDTKLKNGTTTLRQVYSDSGQDLEDQLVVMAEDAFGNSSEDSIAKMRKVLTLKNTPSHAMQHVAELLGLSTAQPKQEPINNGQGV